MNLYILHFKILIMKIIRNIILFFYFLIAAEFFLRLFHPIPMLPRYIIATDYGIRGNQPNVEYQHKTSEYKVHFKLNSKGIRSNHEIPYKKSNKKRILLLGDSFGMGYGVELENSFSEDASRYLIEKGIDNEVINLSVSGYGNAEELIALKHEGQKYKPDIVVLAFHDSDYKDNVRSNLFKLENDSLVKSADTYLPAVKLREKLFSYTLYRWLAGNCNLYSWLREIAGTFSKKILALRNNKIVKESAMKQESTNIARDSTLTNGIEISYADKLTVALLTRIKLVSEEAGAEFLILEIPRSIKRNEFISPIHEYVRDNIDNIYFVSPIPAFHEYDGQILYWEHSEGHFTPLGCKIVGGLLSDYIIKNNLFHE